VDPGEGKQDEDSDSESSEESEDTPEMKHAEFTEPRQGTPRELLPIVVPNLHKTVQYYDVGMYLMAATSPKMHLFQRLEVFLNSVFEADETACFYVVDNKERVQDRLAITVDNFRQHLSKPVLPFWRKYFDWLTPRLRAGWRKVFFLMGHKVKMEDIRADAIDEWHERFWCYPKAMQYSKSVEVGWAFRSHKNLNFEMMSKEISRWCRFPVAVCWKGVMPYDEEKRHHVMHFEVMEERAAEDRLDLCSLYRAFKKEGWLFGMNFRFVPTLDNTNPEAESTVHDLRTRQRIVNHPQRGFSHWFTMDFTDVDRYDRRLKGTLRQYIMYIPSQTRPGLPLFLGRRTSLICANFSWASFMSIFLLCLICSLLKVFASLYILTRLASK
jgi:hypothetical protein